MLDETTITNIVRTIHEKMKAAGNSSDAKKSTDSVYEYADWGKLYKEAKKHTEEIEVHNDGKFPKHLLDYTYPNETEAEKNYRNKAFQPVTKPYWKKGLKTLTRIWAEQNYTIEWKDETAKKYFTQDVPFYNSLIGFFKSVVTNKKINDPNGVLIVDFDLPVKQDGEGQIVIDDSKEIDPYPTVYESEEVIFFEEGEFCCVVSSEKSTVRYNGKDQKIGFVFYLYDTNMVYRIEQAGDKIDWEFVFGVYYTHNLGYLPCWKLRGTTEEVINGNLYYESHFAPAIPHLNEAIIMHSTLKSSISKVAYPVRVYYDQDCTACNNGQVIVGEGDDAKSVNCNVCNGTGKTKFSALTDYKHSLPSTTNNLESVPFPGLAYVSPDSAILEFSKKTIDDYIAKAFLFLNIDAVPDGMKAGLDPTATKSKIDRDEQFVAMLDISNELYELLDEWLAAAYFIRYQKISPIEVNPPKTFELTSATELTTELSEAKQNAIPDIAQAELTTEYVQKRFAQNGQISKLVEVARYCDVLYTKDDADVSLAKSNFATWEIVLHYHIYGFLNEKIEANPDYLDEKKETIKADLVAMAKLKAGELGTGQNNAADIIKSMATA